MNFTENQERSKDEIKTYFLAFFKKQDVAHLAAQKFKDIKQILGYIVHKYDKRFKDLLSQISYNIDNNLLVQWYVSRLLHHVRDPLIMHDIKNLEEAFKKAQQMESYIDVSTPTKKCRLEEKIEMLHKTIRDLSLQKDNLWCYNCQEEGHLKDTCRHQTV